MLQFENGGQAIQSISELPDWIGASEVFLDFETSSGDAKLDSLNPWHNCTVAGFAICVDENPQALWVDPRLFSEDDQEYIRQWLGAILYSCDYWINHNVKYDNQVAHNNYGFDVPCQLVCTVILAKLIDSDRIMRGGYGLDALALGWLGEDISIHEKRLQPYLKDNKDYGRIPTDIVGEYACQDVMTNRRLYRFMHAKLPEQCYGVWATEIELTKNICQMERNGLQLDMLEIQTTQFLALNRMQQIDDELSGLTGRSFRPHVSEDCFDVLCNQYGLPVMLYTKDERGEPTTNPSFDKHALKMYLAHPLAPTDVVKLIMEYRKIAQRNNLFLTPWQRIAVDGVLHPQFNQVVRTGRMSCSDPNAQQLDEIVKGLIHPRKGYAFCSIDFSQIEFRTIVHYIEDEKAIKAFNENPDTDFHQWVADMVGCKRKPAKTVNFGNAFGEGKKKLLKQLQMDSDLIDEMKLVVDKMLADGSIKQDQRAATIASLMEARSDYVYNTYHQTLPGIKQTTKKIEQVLKIRGFIFDLYGRHRHLPVDKAYRGFNTVNQASAADIMKERINAVCRAIVDTPVELCCMVHDEGLFQAPIEVMEDPRTVRDLVAIMESPAVQLRVPVRCAVGVSANNWREASKSAKPLQYSKADAGELQHLKILCN